jgi:hypothetical protein
MGHLPRKFEVGDLAQRKAKSNINLSDKILILEYTVISNPLISWDSYKVLELDTGSITEIIAGLLDNNYKKVT